MTDEIPENGQDEFPSLEDLMDGPAPHGLDPEPEPEPEPKAKPKAKRKSKPKVTKGDDGLRLLTVQDPPLNGTDVRSVQSLLLHVHRIGVGHRGVSGDYDLDTEQAVRQFQSSRKLTETGIVDAETRQRLLTG